MNRVLKLMHSQAGFTMIELILVIAIIGILAVTVLAAINPVTQIRKANDAQRISNVKQVQTAIEQYYSNGAAAYTCNAALLNPYLPDGIPTDPSTKLPLNCQVPNPSVAGNTYCVSATLDNPTGNCNPDCTSGTNTNTYCVTNLQ